MRNKFASKLTQYASENPAVHFLTGDLGYGVVEEFEKKFPKQFTNVGISEQAMIGIATGLAISEKKVFTYSIANFATARCIEQIRDDVCYHNLDVTIIAVGCGFAYGALGYTHYGIEDLALMSSMPNISILTPSDEVSMEYCFEYIKENNRPKYLRILKGKESRLHINPIKLAFGRIIPIIEEPKADNMFISNGSIGQEAFSAIEELKKEDPLLNISLYDSPVLKPFDEAFFLEKVSEVKNLFIAEEHIRFGGLYSIISDILVRNKVNVNVFPILISDNSKFKIIGDQNYLRSIFSLNKNGIYNILKGVLLKK